jgi:hypothetical protein
MEPFLVPQLSKRPPHYRLVLAGPLRTVSGHQIHRPKTYRKGKSYYWECIQHCTASVTHKTNHKHKSHKFQVPEHHNDRFKKKILPISCKSKVKQSPLQARTGPEGSRRLRLPDLTVGTWRWYGCQPYAPAAFTPPPPQYSFLLEVE